MFLLRDNATTGAHARACACIVFVCAVRAHRGRLSSASPLASIGVGWCRGMASQGGLVTRKPRNAATLTGGNRAVCDMPGLLAVSDGVEGALPAPN
jgi:hypothetical protein